MLVHSVCLIFFRYLLLLLHRLLVRVGELGAVLRALKLRVSHFLLGRLFIQGVPGSDLLGVVEC